MSREIEIHRNLFEAIALEAAARAAFPLTEKTTRLLIPSDWSGRYLLDARAKNPYPITYPAIRDVEAVELVLTRWQLDDTAVHEAIWGYGPQTDTLVLSEYHRYLKRGPISKCVIDIKELYLEEYTGR